MHLDRLREALNDLELASRLDPDDLATRLQYASVLGLLKRVPEALESLQEFAHRKPEHTVDTLFHRALLLCNLERTREAIDTYSAILERLASDDTTAAAAADDDDDE